MGVVMMTMWCGFVIAEELIYRYHISTPEAIYRIREIEFYYNSHDYQDPTVYGIIQAKHKNGLGIHRHKKRQSSQFTWFIHYSGIDIVFGEGETPAGILIRAVERIGKNSFADEYIDGPLVVLLELMNQSTSVFDSAPFQLRLVDAKRT
ncbi:MAG: hypothetical protein H0W62_12750 [Chitinophagales bacterium]|nr:hypothetical protein [Chitinophagales bacterium]